MFCFQQNIIKDKQHSCVPLNKLNKKQFIIFSSLIYFFLDECHQNHKRGLGLRSNSVLLWESVFCITSSSISVKIENSNLTSITEELAYS